MCYTLNCCLLVSGNDNEKRWKAHWRFGKEGGTRGRRDKLTKVATLVQVGVCLMCVVGGGWGREKRLVVVVGGREEVGGVRWWGEGEVGGGGECGGEVL